MTAMRGRSVLPTVLLGALACAGRAPEEGEYVHVSLDSAHASGECVEGQTDRYVLRANAQWELTNGAGYLHCSPDGSARRDSPMTTWGHYVRRGDRIELVGDSGRVGRSPVRHDLSMTEVALLRGDTLLVPSAPDVMPRAPAIAYVCKR